MERLRQIHSDESVCTISLRDFNWDIRLTVPRKDGSTLNLLGLRAGSLDEAKAVSEQVLKKEHPSHTCSTECQDWAEF
jgi:hypothetical protein